MLHKNLESQLVLKTQKIWCLRTTTFHVAGGFRGVMAAPLKDPAHYSPQLQHPYCFSTPGMNIGCTLSLHLTYYFIIAEEHFSVSWSLYQEGNQKGGKRAKTFPFWLLTCYAHCHDWSGFCGYLLSMVSSYENGLSKSSRHGNKSWFFHLILFGLKWIIWSLYKSVFLWVK